MEGEDDEGNTPRLLTVRILFARNLTQNRWKQKASVSQNCLGMIGLLSVESSVHRLVRAVIALQFNVWV